MGSIMSAIADDIDHYEWLCTRFGEKTQYSHGSADCYGSHAEELKWWLEQDKRAEAGLTYDYLDLCVRFDETPRWHSYGKLPDIAGYYAKQLEDRARIEDGLPPRVEQPGVRPSRYVTVAEVAQRVSQQKTRFDHEPPI